MPDLADHSAFDAYSPLIWCASGLGRPGLLPPDRGHCGAAD